MQSIEAIYIKYYDELLFLANKLTDDPEASEDIVQDVFLRLLKGTHDNPQKQLYTSVKNGCLNYIRNKKYTRYLFQIEDKDYYHEEIYARFYGLLHRHIESLPPQQQIVIKLYLDGYKNPEICEHMCISDKMVRNHKSLAIAKLRQLIKPMV